MPRIETAKVDQLNQSRQSTQKYLQVKPFQKIREHKNSEFAWQCLCLLKVSAKLQLLQTYIYRSYLAQNLKLHINTFFHSSVKTMLKIDSPDVDCSNILSSIFIVKTFISLH